MFTILGFHIRQLLTAPVTPIESGGQRTPKCGEPSRQINHSSINASSRTVEGNVIKFL